MGIPPVNNQFIDASERDKAKVFEQQMQATSIATCLLSEDQISGIVALGLAQLKKHQTQTEAAKQKSDKEILQAALLEHIEQLNREIAELEERFKVQFGDAWREEIALRILGEDEIPRQQDGESIEDYRMRLEESLMAEMLDEDGSIKSYYRDHDELLQYAEWAQKTYHRNAAQGLANTLEDPNITHPQEQKVYNVLEKARNSELNVSTADELEGHRDKQEAVLSVDESHYTDASQQEQSGFKSGFFTPSGS